MIDISFLKQFPTEVELIYKYTGQDSLSKSDKKALSKAFRDIAIIGANELRQIIKEDGNSERLSEQCTKYKRAFRNFISGLIISSIVYFILIALFSIYIPLIEGLYFTLFLIGFFLALVLYLLLLSLLGINLGRQMNRVIYELCYQFTRNPLVSDDRLSPIIDTSSIRKLDMDEKKRILLEANIDGNHIMVIRQFKVTSLVVNDYVYAEKRGLIEQGYLLEAYVHGMKIKFSQVIYGKVYKIFLYVNNRKISEKVRSH